MKKVIVIGGNHHNTLAVLRSLGERGIKSSLIVHTGDKHPFTTYCKYVERSIILRSYDGIENAMYDLKNNNDKPVVIACSDRVSSYLDQNWDDLSKDFILPGGGKTGIITSLMDKEAMGHLASECGLTIPKSWIAEPSCYNSDLYEYPCVVKPLISIEGSKSDIYVCNSKKELERCMSEIRCSKVQIQYYIDKDFEFQLIGCSLNKGEIVIIPGASVILRQPQNTNTGFLKYIPLCDFQYEEESCRSFLKSTNYSGLFSIEFLRGKDDKDYFMEINFRNDGNSICVTASGMNLPLIWYLYNSGLSYEDELCYDKMKRVLVMPEFDDFHFVRTREIGFAAWIKDVRRTDRFMEFSKKDPMPFLQKLKTLLLIKFGLERYEDFN